MKIFPIIPIPIMLIICVSLVILTINKRKVNYIKLGIILLLFIINLRIMIPNKNAKVLSNNLDVLFVIDSSLSMNAIDYQDNKMRMEGVRKDCEYIINSLSGARFSLITFNHNAKKELPFTKDQNLMIEAINTIYIPDPFYAKGSSLNTPIDVTKETLKSISESSDRTRILFFISDGEITDNSKLESYSEIAKYISDGAVLGYGTTTGGRIKYKTYYDDDYRYLDHYDSENGNINRSYIDERNLKQIAKDLNIDYINMNKSKNIDKKLNELNNVIKNGLDSNDKSSFDDIYFIFVIPLLVLIVIELDRYRRLIT